MPTTDLVRTPRQLTPAWAQAVVDRHGSGVTVAGVEVASVDVGTTTRVRLVVDHDGPPDLPRRWFVKLPSASWRARMIAGLPRLPQTEVRFYQEIAGGVGVTHPKVMAAATRRGKFTLALGDVTEAGGRAGDPRELLSREQAGQMIDLLARLHARFWEDPRFSGELAWLAGPVRKLEDRLGTALAVPLMRRGLARAGGAVPDALRPPALRYARKRRAAMRTLAAGPATLIHHDCHPGNLYWNDGKPGLLDWQLVRIGEGVGDVAYLLAVGMEPESRREAEPELLERYGLALASHGVARPDPAELLLRYRAHTTYAFEAMVVTLAVGGLMPDDVITELVRRAASAVADHGALELVLSG